MDMTGERRIPAPRDKVWAALNDPDVLKASIPGCQTLEKEDDTHFKATAAIKIGPIAARFAGNVQLLDLDPPAGYRIDGEGNGGVAGFAKGGATVRLAEDGPDATVLTYDVKAQVGGKIAQLGARLIDATAKQMADAFFNRFVAEVAASHAAPAASDATSFHPGANLDAGGAAGLATAATAPARAPVATVRPATPSPAGISVFSLIPDRIYGYPIVAWIGAIIFLGIFILIFGSYL